MVKLKRLLCPVFVLLSLSAAAPGESHPSSTIELAGPWRCRVSDDPGLSEPEVDDADWPRVELPAHRSELGIEAGAGSVWCRRAFYLGTFSADAESRGGLAVKLGASPYGSYEAYAGGLLLGRFLGPSLGMPEPPPRVFRVPGASLGAGGRLVLALRYQPASWLSPPRGEPAEPAVGHWIIGDLHTLSDGAELESLRALKADLPPLLLGVLLAVLGGYHLALYILRRSPREHLWLGLLTATAGLNAFLDSHWVYSMTQNHDLVQRLMEGSIHLIVALTFQLLWPFLGRPLEPLPRAYQLSQLALAAFVLTAPDASWIPRTSALRWAWQAPALVAVLALIVSRLRAGNREARTLAWGAAPMIPILGLEIGSQLLGYGTLAPWGSVAFAFFFFSIEMALVDRQSRLYVESDELRQQLEEMVNDRTSELEQANERLRSENSERRTAEEAMRMLERAVEQSSDGIAVADLAGHVQFLNQAWARMHGYEVFDVLGHHLSLFHTPEHMREQTLPLIEKVKVSGAYDGEVWHRRRDGDLFPTWMSVTLLHDPEGDAVGFVIIARDITERKRATDEQLRLETRLQQAQKLESLAALASGTAHDYNNLLTSILGNSALAREILDTESTAGEHIRQIEVAAERAAKLSDQLLAFAGEEQGELERLDLNAVVEDTRSELEALVGSRVALELYLKKRLPPVEVDPRQLRRLLVNLVTNAFEAIDQEDSFICLRTGRRQVDRSYLAGSILDEGQPEGEYVFLEVADPGAGMDEATQSRMFDPFFSTKESDRGLGLATVLGIVRAHRGTIKVYSAPGQGTTVEILLPAATSVVEAAGGSDVVDLDQWRDSGILLVVDDEQIIRDISKAILKPHGFEVLTACDGHEAIEIYRRRGVEIRAILLDLTMPSMDGERAFHAVRRIDPQARIILMSGYKKREAIRALSELPLADFLAKPFRPADLISKVYKMLGQNVTAGSAGSRRLTT